MQEIFTIEHLVTFGGYILAGGLFILGLFGMGARQKRGDDDKLTQNLISNYRLTVEQQEKQIRELSEKEVAQGKQIAHLEGQVKVLSDMVALRDPETQRVFKEAPAAFATARETHEMSKANGQKIDKLTETLTTFMQTLTRALPTLKS